jgi:hypothetical protein
VNFSAPTEQFSFIHLGTLKTMNSASCLTYCALFPKAFSTRVDFRVCTIILWTTSNLHLITFTAFFLTPLYPTSLPKDKLALVRSP